ncbi:hypothetical protein DFP73DRAFT_208286 [Morchella snyderi]|nr:hypothetical protein DFP73DRAFT_208286 [Morchella snyderi]
MTDDNTNQKKRKSKWITSYSSMTNAQAEKRLGFRIRSVKAVSVDTMLANTKYSFGREYPDAILKTKERVYDNIVEYLAIEGPVLGNFIRMTGRKSIQLRSEKEIVSPDGETGGMEDFVMVDLISVEDEKFVLIVEAKRSSLGLAMKQCLLAMKDMRANNGGVGAVYGFVTTGESWRMISYDGTFQVTNKMDVIFDTMDEEKELWMKDFSVLVDCIYAALNNGGQK